MALEPITRQEKIIAGQDLTPITRMEKFLKQFGGGGGGLPTGGAAYQQLVTDGEGNAKWEDRMAYRTGDSITWDGDTADLVNADGMFYKVSDLTPTKEELIGANWSVPDGTFTLTADDLLENENCLLAGAAIISYADGASGFDFTFPEKGTYFGYTDPDNHTFSLSWVELKPIDKIYIPVMDEVILNSSTAGSTKQFKITVDDSGTLSATEV